VHEYRRFWIRNPVDRTGSFAETHEN
jgi:hypothetical protein